MQKKFAAKLLAVLTIAVLIMTSAYAASYQSADVPIGSSNQVLMVGEIQPSIMSVTIPAYVPFNIAHAVPEENKVISPRITITNNSSVPVALDVVYTTVDLSKLQGTSWSDNGIVGSNQIAIGFQSETITNQMPAILAGTKWLMANKPQNINITSVGAFDSSVVYVVGTLGDTVPENHTFTVMPTFVVRQA